MAFKAKDGKAFGNRQQMSAYDERSGDAKAMPDENEQEPDAENSPEDIHEMVAQHGPAEKVVISHADGKHTKTSHHGGKKHVSEHGSAEEAHQHGMMAAGVEPSAQEEQPAMAGGGAMQQGGSIPRNVMQRVPQQISLVRDAYVRGKDSAYYGFQRVSPFYNERVLIAQKRIDITPMLDAFWYAGFDGEPYPDKTDEVMVEPELAHAIQEQSAAAISGSESGQGGRTGEVEGVGAGDGLSRVAGAPAAEEGAGGAGPGKIET